MELANVAWWLLSVALIVVGVVGTVMPVLPGSILVLGGIVLGAWIDDFTKVGVWTLVFVAVLAVLAWAADHVAGLLGAQRAGASAQAMWGAAIGTVLGIFGGLVGVLLLPLVGAAVGEFLARRDQLRALHVGAATWLGMIAGIVAKLVLTFAMIGTFVVALLF